MVTVGLHEGGSEMTTGAPTLLLIHGFLDDASAWDGLVESLAGEVAAVRYDLPGFGTRSGSVADARTATLESLAAEAGDILDGIDGPVIVVGQSLGTQVAELVAAQHPERVRGLVLLTPVPLGGTRLPEEVVAPFRTLGGDSVAQRRLRAQLSPHLSEEQLDRLADIGAPVAPEVTAHYVDVWNNGVSNAPATSAFAGPVLIVRGSADAFATEQLIDAVIPRFVQPEIKVIDKGGHWVHVEYPGTVATMILDFTDAIAEVTP
jgi:pimeloyl-ACP methyl ester carboxylesterase